MQKKAEFQSVNDAVYQWYCLVRYPVSGPILQTETRLTANKLILRQAAIFQKSFWSKLKQLTLSGKAADVPQETIQG